MDHFPYENFRPGQKETILSILDAFKSGKRFVLLEAPTGSGKSAIAYTVAMHFKRSYYLTSTKILQTQLWNDFGASGRLAVLKGRNAYPCVKWPKVLNEISRGERPKLRTSLSALISRPDFKFDCSVGFCKLQNQTKRGKKDQEASLPGCDADCVYKKAMQDAKDSKICVMNFDSFLYQTAYNHVFRGDERDLMVADECHNSESKLLDFVSLVISDKDLPIRLEEKKTPDQYAKYFKDIGLVRMIGNMRLAALQSDDVRLADKLENLLSKLDIFFDEIGTSKWICNFVKRYKYRVIEIKPLFVRHFAKRNLFSLSKKVLMMSATILSPDAVMDSLGIDKDETAFFRMPSHFPLDKRSIVLDPCGSLSYKNKHNTFPKLVKKIDEICGAHKGQKGIIHTHNFEIANLLLDSCKNTKRFLFQKNFDSKKEMLEEHSNGHDSIIIAPAMHEGLDLIDDLSRFQVICKIPYPNQNDNPQLKERVNLSWNYYVWLTALKLVQSYGRSVRHDEDWATTYIVDSDFARFMDMAIDILPDWFLEAINAH
jgi:Rad3-related DNA helicase